MVFLLCIGPGVWRLFGNLPELLARLPRGTKAGAIHWQSTFHVSDRVASREMPNPGGPYVAGFPAAPAAGGG